MYPQLIAASQRLAPLISRLMASGARSAFSPMGRFSQIDIPELPPAQPVPPGQPPEPAPPVSGPNDGPANYSAGASPLDRLRDAFSQFPGQTQQPPAMEDMHWPYGPVGAPSGTTQAATPNAAPVPEAPQPQPDTSFFMRNAMMMRDPATGQFIDPTGAASVRGPDLIAKMMSYLHNKA